MLFRSGLALRGVIVNILPKVWMNGSWCHTSQIQILAKNDSLVNWNKLPHFFHLLNGDKRSSYFTGCFCGLGELHWTLKHCFPGGSEVKVSACNVGDLGLIPGSGRSPGEGNCNPLLIRESDGWRSLVGYSPRGCKESDRTE